MTTRTRVLALMLAFATTGMTAALAQQARSDADQALHDKAVAACNGPQYPSGAHPYINYSGGWFRCVEPRDR